MSKIAFLCSNCHNPVQVDRGQTTVYCPLCMAELIVPETAFEPEPAPEPAPEPEAAPPPDPDTAPPPAAPSSLKSPSQVLYSFTRPASAAAAATDDDLEFQPIPLVHRDPHPDEVTAPPPNTLDTADDATATEFYDPDALGVANEAGELGLQPRYAGQLDIASPEHALAHERRVRHAHRFPHTPDGVFQPFPPEELTALIEREGPAFSLAVEALVRGPQAWPCAIFATLLAGRVADALGRLDDVSCPTVMFGSLPKALSVLRERYLEFLRLMARLYPAFGANFQYALTHYDLTGFVASADTLSAPLQDINTFMRELQRLPLPRKEPLAECRGIMLGWHRELSERLTDVVERLRARATLEPKQADLSTINVALMPASLTRLNARLHAALGIPSA